MTDRDRATDLLAAAGLRLERPDGRPLTDADLRRAFGVLAAVLDRPCTGEHWPRCDGNRSYNR